MKTYQLINKETKICESIFVESQETDLNLNGILLEPVSWNLEDKPVECDFIAVVYIKWDGCSHFWFRGQDYINDPNKDDRDSYYHICGFNSYIKHIRSIIFAWQLANDLTKNGVDKCETEDYNKFKSQVDLLNGYEIKEVEVDKDDQLYWYIQDLLAD